MYDVGRLGIDYINLPPGGREKHLFHFGGGGGGPSRDSPIIALHRRFIALMPTRPLVNRRALRTHFVRAPVHSFIRPTIHPFVSSLHSCTLFYCLAVS